MTRGLREAQREFTRERLLEATVTACADKGYAAATIDEIASRAGATRATFYLHFKSKAEVVVELRSRLRAVFDPLWTDLGTLKPRPTRQAISRWLIQATSTWEAHRDLSAVVYQGTVAERELALDLDAERERSLTTFVAAIRHLGWHDDDEARLEAMLLLAQIERMFAYWNFESDAADDRGAAREKILDLLTENWHAAFRRAGKRATPPEAAPAPAAPA